MVWLILNDFVEVYGSFGCFGYGDLDFVKTKVNDAAVSSGCFYNAKFPYSLFNEELSTLENRAKSTKLVVRKADKDYSMV